jgi:acetyltransferase
VMNWRLSDGSEVLLRPIRPEDEPLEYEMLTTASSETIRGRFFQNIQSVTHEFLTRLCNIDYDREIAIVAEIKDAQKRKLIGIGRLIIEPDLRNGEFSVVVHDHYQTRGIGYKLLDTIIGIAQDKEVETLFGIVLAANGKMISLVKKMGFSIEPLPEGLIKANLSLK